MHPAHPFPAGLDHALQRGVLACPVCRQALQARDRSLVCPARHCFDIARQGHVHLAPGKRASPGKGPSYDRELMEARGRIVAQGFFAPLVAWCADRLGSRKEPVLLDAGCGEGSFLERLCSALHAIQPLGVGVDLSPDGVKLAASRYKQQAWSVADLAALPITDGACSVILNILSPANYQEFNRVLRPDGLIIKAIPTSRHLEEIRQALGAGESFTNQRVTDHFRASYPTGESSCVETSLPCTQDNAATFLSMTPLGWHASREARARFQTHPPANITVSLQVLVGLRADAILSSNSV